MLIGRSDDVDRESTIFQFRDKNIGNSWTQLKLQYADSDDGHWNEASLIRPFYSLDARWTAGGAATDFDIENKLYDEGEKVAEYRHERTYYNAFGGWSNGLQDGWVRRYKAGFAYDENIFSEVPDGDLIAAIPDDRLLVYPYVSFEILEDKFDTAQNRNQIRRTEDFLTGWRLTATLGWSDEDFGADRDAALYWLTAHQTIGDISEESVLLDASASGRIEDGESVNALLKFSARYYKQQTEKFTFFANATGTWGDNLDLDNLVELGGDSGLRGYPLRYQVGDSKVLFTVEQRWFSDWYPFRFFRVGAAVFADAGSYLGRQSGRQRQPGLARRCWHRAAPCANANRDAQHHSRRCGVSTERRRLDRQRAAPDRIEEELLTAELVDLGFGLGDGGICFGLAQVLTLAGCIGPIQAAAHSGRTRRLPWPACSSKPRPARARRAALQFRPG